MIINPDIIKNKKGFNKHIAKWLIYEKGIPLLGLHKGIYYFSCTEELEKALKEMPLLLKIFFY